MSDQEFDLLDELYFVQSYDYLVETLGWDEATLRATLMQLYNRAWIKCYKTAEEELLTESLDLNANAHLYHYLASKAGLLAHNLK